MEFEWVYQPDGTTDFSKGTTSGRVQITAATAEDPSSANCAGFSFGVLGLGTAGHIEKSDFFYANYEGNSNTFWPVGLGGFHDMGDVSLESVTFALYKAEGSTYYNTQPTSVILGHTYTVVTADGAHYAKLRVTWIQMPRPIY